MRIFKCPSCTNVVYFHNSVCAACGTGLGYTPDEDRMVALSPTSKGFVSCKNVEHGVCNWVIRESASDCYCRSCRHNNLAPDLSVEGNLARWQKVELAKRHLFYSLLRWRLPTPAAGDNVAEPLSFDLVADVVSDQGTEKVLTGHDSGHITLNIAEADDDERERRRTAMKEPYRTLLGHFRHEIGHYYWDLLVRDDGRLDEFRKFFGDEREDYSAALQRYYADGAPPDWRLSYISAYSTAHPWEDFAETWAHHTHIVDTLETAHAWGLSIQPKIATSSALAADLAFDPYGAASFGDIVDAWATLSVALNTINRSLGQPDAYPFILSNASIDKLAFVHRLIVEQATLVNSSVDRAR